MTRAGQAVFADQAVFAKNWAGIISRTYDESVVKRNCAVAALSISLLGCSTHHWAEVESSRLPPPSTQPILHTSRLIIDVSRSTGENQCVVDEQHHPVCFYNIRPALETGLARNLWPSFPEVIAGASNLAGPMDYVLQVEVTLDALAPDGEGPGWAAGVRGRYRLLRAGTVLMEETTASRSRSHFPYGGPLGQGATEAMDATIQHIAQSLFQVEETRPDEPAALPQVAARNFTPPARTKTSQSSSSTASSSTALKPRLDQAATAAPLAKTSE